MPYYSETLIVRQLRIRRTILRKMEEEGIIKPLLKDGEKYYHEEQIPDIIFARNLISCMGVNLPGVVVAIKMRRNFMKAEEQVEQLLEYVKKRLEEDEETF